MKKYIRETLLFMAAAILASGVWYAATAEENQNTEYDIVFLGDSIAGNMNGEVTIPEILAERLGKTVYNGALGGTCMSYNNTGTWESMPAGQWSMVKLAQAIYADDWTSQKAMVSYAEEYRLTNQLVLDYFYERIQGLAQIDFSEAEVLIIEHGTNDYNSGQLLESQEDPMDITTFAGALRTSLSLIQEKYPALRIVIVSPLYCEIVGSNREILKCYETDFGGGTLDDFVKKEQEIVREYGVEWIDLYNGSGIWEENIDVFLYDKLHPTDEAEVIIGNLIAECLETN